MAKQKRPDEGGKPWCIQPELVEGCSMRYGFGHGGLCHFCGLQAIRSGPGNYKYMTVPTAMMIARDCADFCPKARIEFAMRGEPLMNPNHLKIFDVFRQHLPKTQMMVTTNGDTLRGKMEERAENIFAAGINFILLDTYYPEERRRTLIDEAYSLDKTIKIVDYFQEWMPLGESPYHNHGNKIQRTIVLMDDLAARDKEHSSRLVKTHAGANPSKPIDESFPLKRNCGRPFREMTITWNGNVTLCCDDWKKEYIIANIDLFHLEDIWAMPSFEAARRILLAKDRSFGPCQSCDAPSAPRTGLLPDYEPPTEDDYKIVEKVFEPKKPIWEMESH